jgi:hypothetical protein
MFLHCLLIRQTQPNNEWDQKNSNDLDIKMQWTSIEHDWFTDCYKCSYIQRLTRTYLKEHLKMLVISSFRYYWRKNKVLECIFFRSTKNRKLIHFFFLNKHRKKLHTLASGWPHMSCILWPRHWQGNLHCNKNYYQHMHNTQYLSVK